MMNGKYDHREYLANNSWVQLAFWESGSAATRESADKVSLMVGPHRHLQLEFEWPAQQPLVEMILAMLAFATDDGKGKCKEELREWLGVPKR